MEEQVYYDESPIDRDHPFGFFEDFFLKGGFREFHTKFYTEEYKSEIGEWSAYSHPKKNMSTEEEYMLLEGTYYNDPDNPLRIYFKDELWIHLLNQKKYSCKLIEQKIDSLQQETEIVTYLKKLTIHLFSLASSIKLNSEINKYKAPLRIIYLIINWLNDKYCLFYNGINSPIIEEAIDHQEKIITETRILLTENKPNFEVPSQNSPSTITGFKWKSEPTSKIDFAEIYNGKSDIDTKTIKLYTILKKYKVIPDDNITKQEFVLAFHESSLTKPLKIRWLLKTRGNLTKPSIIRVIKYTLMKRLGVIENIEDRTELAKKLEFIFVDSQGNSIANMFQSLTDVKDLSEYKIEKNSSQEAILINAIIDAFTVKSS